MPDVTRRRLLRTAGAAVTAAFAAEFLPPGVRRALASGPAPGGSLSDIKHVVILMQENRSFDHYFGTLANVRGFNDPTAITLSSGKAVFYQPDKEHPDGYLLPFHLDTRTTSAQAQPSTCHAWGAQHASWNHGQMNNWLPAHLEADGADGRYTMGYLDRYDIPFHYALAENFTICDNYHCSVLGPTWPNRLYHLSAWDDPLGDAGGPVIANTAPDPLDWKTYPEALTEAGVSWQVYQEVDNYQCNSLELFRSFQNAPVNAVTGARLGDTTVGAEPYAVVTAGPSVYVADMNDDQVSVLSSATGRVTGRIDVGRLPMSLAVTPDGAQVWVGNGLSGSISVISVASGKVVRTISGGPGTSAVDTAPLGIAFA
ncbi:MAG TPA: alkaline phosphatase family protein, partial [Streptosporangiaceae bacterium]